MCELSSTLWNNATPPPPRRQARCRQPSRRGVP